MELKELLFKINLPVKLADGTLSKEGKNLTIPYLQNCQFEQS